MTALIREAAIHGTATRERPDGRRAGSGQAAAVAAPFSNAASRRTAAAPEPGITVVGAIGLT